MRTPNNVRSLTISGTCVNTPAYEVDSRLEASTRADKRKIDSLVKKHLPDLYNDLSLNLRNPYDYFKSEGYLILQHSAIYYFLTYTI